MAFFKLLRTFVFFTFVYCVSAKGVFKKTENDADSGKRERVVGGGFVRSITDVPYQVTIKHAGLHLCGGAIVSHWHIVTAAHCFADVDIKKLTVVTGTHDLRAKGDVHQVKQITTHPSYHTNVGVHNDIAVVHLKKYIIFNDRQQPITLPAHDTKPGDMATVTGWGFMMFPASGPVSAYRSPYLKIAKLPVVSDQMCYDTQDQKTSRQNVCTFKSPGTGTCYGDSGSPLVVGKSLVGVVSWGTPCAVGRPDVYARVFTYKNFIAKCMESR